MFGLEEQVLWGKMKGRRRLSSGSLNMSSVGFKAYGIHIHFNEQLQTLSRYRPVRSLLACQLQALGLRFLKLEHKKVNAKSRPCGSLPGLLRLNPLSFLSLWTRRSHRKPWRNSWKGSAEKSMKHKIWKSPFYLSFWRSTSISCERVEIDNSKSQFFLSFWRSTSISCERVAADYSTSQFYLRFWPSTSISCERVEIDNSKSQFYFSFWRSTSISCERVEIDNSNRNFTSVFDFRRPFRAKGLKWTPQNRNFSSVFDVRHPFRAEGLKIPIFPQFLTFDVHFVRKGCVSWRSGGPAPALERKKERKKSERETYSEREEICRHVKM